jgi:hypothetical protein
MSGEIGGERIDPGRGRNRGEIPCSEGEVDDALADVVGGF